MDNCIKWLDERGCTLADVDQDGQGYYILKDKGREEAEEKVYLPIEFNEYL
jgi:hypothetical protein